DRKKAIPSWRIKYSLRSMCISSSSGHPILQLLADRCKHHGHRKSHPEGRGMESHSTHSRHEASFFWASSNVGNHWWNPDYDNRPEGRAELGGRAIPYSGSNPQI